MKRINNGNATTIWNGISHNHLLARCDQASECEASAMSAAAGLMLAGDCSQSEWDEAMAALYAVEARICAEWEEKNGAPLLNRYGQILGGAHPVLCPDRYAEALTNRARAEEPAKGSRL